MRWGILVTEHIQIVISLFLGLILSGSIYFYAFAQDNNPPNPVDRTSKIEIDEIEYHWQLIFWSDKSAACDFVINHNGEPTDNEIRNSCGKNLLDELKNTPSCANGTKICTGLYVHNVSSIPVHKKIEVQLSPPSVWLSLSGCDYSENENYCVGDPELVFTGEEPLPNERIIRIQGNLSASPFSCESGECSVKLSPTDAKGAPLTFWGDSSFGDSTVHFTGFVRVIPVDNTPNAYYIDVISDQWRGKDPPSCSDIWQVFPESLDLPAWLDTPQNASDLSSTDTLYFLSAALINNGIVDASSCENNGLSDAITANECGVTMAAPKVQYWQNLFDQEIFSVAQNDGVPAQLLKNIFLRESQLWPGIYKDIKEVGLGQLTDNGADTTLLWNPDFFNSFCPLVLDKSVCAYGYAQLPAYTQSILRGALLRKTNASCPDCTEKIDLTKASFSIHVFAETMKANCSQVNQLITNTTKKAPRDLSSYSDLWRFTLINYNAGPGCLGNALKRTWSANQPIDWAHVASNLDQACRTAVDYVSDISEGDTTNITVFSTPLPTGSVTPQPTNTITLTPTLTATSTPSPTSTELTITSTSTPTEQSQGGN
jgi:hypothetical protein